VNGGLSAAGPAGLSECAACAPQLLSSADLDGKLRDAFESKLATVLESYVSRTEHTEVRSRWRCLCRARARCFGTERSFYVGVSLTFPQMMETRSTAFALELQQALKGQAYELQVRLCPSCAVRSVPYF
jgi:hypothetical protein